MQKKMIILKTSYEFVVFRMWNMKWTRSSQVLWSSPIHFWFNHIFIKYSCQIFPFPLTHTHDPCGSAEPFSSHWSGRFTGSPHFQWFFASVLYVCSCKTVPSQRLKIRRWLYGTSCSYPTSAAWILITTSFLD